MVFELGNIADPPLMVTYTMVLRVGPRDLVACNLLTSVNGLYHGAVGMATAACVVDLARSRILIKIPEHLYQIAAVDVISYLFALVAENSIMLL